MFVLPTNQRTSSEDNRVIATLRNTQLEMKNDINDFTDGLPKTRKGIEGVWVIMDRLTKSTFYFGKINKNHCFIS